MLFVAREQQLFHQGDGTEIIHQKEQVRTIPCGINLKLVFVLAYDVALLRLQKAAGVLGKIKQL